MNAEIIIIKTPKQIIEVPNKWELLAPEQFLFLVALIAQYALGKATMGDVKLFFLCKTLNLKLKKIINTDVMANLIIIAEQIDFIFDEKGMINFCFLKQLVPELKIQQRKFLGYEINTSFDTLTCSLTAAQFIDAQDVMKGGADKLPLLAAILYCPQPYSSDIAHNLASQFAYINQLQLSAVALNFQALAVYLFTRTHFSVLSAGKKEYVPEIATGLTETMFNLSADGMGDIDTIKQMSIIDFLTILRKKLIECVKAMHDAKMDIAEISYKTGLNSQIIKKML